MGLTQAKPTVSNEIEPLIPYLCGTSDNMLTVDPNVELFVQTSTLPSGFIHGYHKGLFTKTPLTKGTVICGTDNNLSLMSNDGMINLEPLLRASNSQETYTAWVDMKKNYYDLEKAKQVINIRMVSDNNGKFYETICDVPANSELIRMYGFTTWTLELFNTLTNKNIAGFSKFIQELDGNIVGDPYEKRVSNLRAALATIVPEIETVDLASYDSIHSSEPLRYLTTNLEAAYLLTCNS